jgi:hypothetical protein
MGSATRLNRGVQGGFYVMFCELGVCQRGHMCTLGYTTSTYEGPETPTGCAMLAHQSHGVPDMLRLPNSGPNGPQLTLVGPFGGLSGQVYIGG